MRFEQSAALAGAMLVVLTIIVCYVAMLAVHDPDDCKEVCDAGKAQEGFMNRLIYRPACGNQWLWNRRDSCRGHTGGTMPSIDDVPLTEGGPCIPSYYDMDVGDLTSPCCMRAGCDQRCVLAEPGAVAVLPDAMYAAARAVPM